MQETTDEVCMVHTYVQTSQVSQCQELNSQPSVYQCNALPLQPCSISQIQRVESLVFNYKVSYYNGSLERRRQC